MKAMQVNGSGPGPLLFRAELEKPEPRSGEISEIRSEPEL